MLRAGTALGEPCSVQHRFRRAIVMICVIKISVSRTRGSAVPSSSISDTSGNHRPAPDRTSTTTATLCNALKAFLWGLMWVGRRKLCHFGDVRRRHSTRVIWTKQHRAPALCQNFSAAVPAASAAAADCPGTGAPVAGGVSAPRAAAAEPSPPTLPVLPPPRAKAHSFVVSWLAAVFETRTN